jgi:hypothetical protein
MTVLAGPASKMPEKSQEKRGKNTAAHGVFVRPGT